MAGENPILNNPYEEPRFHYATNLQGELDYSRIETGRRYFTGSIQSIPVPQSSQGDLLTLNELGRTEYGTHIVNLLRKEVGMWRSAKYPNTTRVTRELLYFWFLNDERADNLKLFFAQREAIETAIFLNEVAEKSNPGQNILRLLQSGQTISASAESNLPRIAFKMATGTGKTVVMAALIVLWYGKGAKDEKLTKFRPLFEKVPLDSEALGLFKFAELPDGTVFEVNKATAPDGETFDYRLSPKRLLQDFPDVRLFCSEQLTSGGERKNQSIPFTFQGREFNPGAGRCWKTTVRSESGEKPGMQVLAEQNRLWAGEGQLRYKRYYDDFGYQRLSNWWDSLGGAANPVFVVQTNPSIIQRCILMTTDPGDLVLDPTCGSGTTAYVAEQWGRRWITIDTSRIALSIAKARLLTATFPYYRLHDSEGCDIRQGFIYKKVPHITLGSIANNELAADETLYDQPAEDKRRLRVAGPFTVETLQSYEPISPEELAARRESEEDLARFEDLVFEHLKSAGIKTGDKSENAVFVRIDRLASSNLHAEGFYNTPDGEKRAYLHIGPKFGTVSKRAVEEAIKECRQKGDAGWLIILGFSFDSPIQNRRETFSMGTFEVTRVRMHDDLLQEGLLKRDKKAASFVTIGEPDICLHRGKDGTAHVEIAGLDIYDPIKDLVKSRDVHDIAYWMLDDDYDGSNFVVKQVFFCGGDKDEFDAWKKGIESLAAQSARRRAEQTLKLQLDEEAFARIYGHKSHPFKVKPGQKIAVRVISQFGEETTKVLPEPIR